MGGGGGSVTIEEGLADGSAGGGGVISSCAGCFVCVPAGTLGNTRRTFC